MNSNPRVPPGSTLAVVLLAVTAAAAPPALAHTVPLAGTSTATGIAHVLVEPAHGLLLGVATALLVAAQTDGILRTRARVARSVTLGAGLAVAALGFVHGATEGRDSFTAGAVVGAAISLAVGGACGLLVG